MKKTIAIAFLSAMAFSSSIFAASTNSGALTVKSIKADWGLDWNGKERFYYYAFEGDFGGVAGGCRGNFDSFTQDPNINRLLQMAYMEGVKVKVGIDAYTKCAISTAELQ
jgi:hypothetical protein